MCIVFALGLEHEFQQTLLPDGRISIDGFICVFDVSEVSQRPASKQTEYVTCIMAQLAKTKKPIVLATTKNDELVRSYAVEAEHLLTRKELRSAGPIPIVETSANFSVNVEHAFMTLAHLIERVSSGVSGKLRLRLVPYSEALRARHDLLDGAIAAYNELVNYQVSSEIFLQLISISCCCYFFKIIFQKYILVEFFLVNNINTGNIFAACCWC